MSINGGFEGFGSGRWGFFKGRWSFYSITKTFYDHFLMIADYFLLRLRRFFEIDHDFLKGFFLSFFIKYQVSRYASSSKSRHDSFFDHTF